jgi:Zn-finger nucleic acid-binding protein
MTYFKCKSCKARLYSVANPDSLADLCPGCRTLLEPDGELVEVAGYHSIADRSSRVALSSFLAAPTAGLSG